MQTVTYIPPALCGCEFKITADFHDVVNGVTYQRPTPFSIRNIEIVKCCDSHQQYKKKMIDTSLFFDTPEPSSHAVELMKKYPDIKIAPKQSRGYLKYPIENPTEAEMLFTYHCLHKGQTHTLVCGCSAYQHKDDKGDIAYKDHPHHSKKCDFHPKDTVNMKQAHADHKALTA